MLYGKHRLRKYGIESAVTFGKSRSRSHVVKMTQNWLFLLMFNVDFAIVYTLISFFIEYLCISPQSLSR